MHIKELILKTTSVKDTRQFYQQTLELEIVGETQSSVSFKAGSTTLTFEEQPGEKPFYHFAFTVAANMFLSCFERMKTRLEILPLYGNMIVKYENWNAESFYFHDNNGNIVEFIARYHLPHTATESSPAACIAEVSEIGLVTRDVQRLALRLQQQYGIPYFERGPVLPDFKAMGNDYGLLLVCKENRGWVPTQQPAKFFPVTVVTGDGNLVTL